MASPTRISRRPERLRPVYDKSGEGDGGLHTKNAGAIAEAQQHRAATQRGSVM